MAYSAAGFYVLDEMCPLGILEAIVSGPFATAAEAAADRREINIGDDCSVYFLDRDANVARRA